jgi:hypothetical protein
MKEKVEEAQEVKAQAPQQQKVSVEQVAQRMQILQFEIKQRQVEYQQLHDNWLKVMTTKPEEKQ